MLPLEKSLIRRLGDAGWVLYWVPRLHTMSKIYSLQSPPYRKESYMLVKRIETDIANFYRREKAELDRCKELPISNLRHISRDKYLRAVAALNRKRDNQKSSFLRDNMVNAAREVEVNLAWDAFEAGLVAYSSDDYSLADGIRFLRTYVEQDNPPLGGKRVASLYHEVKRFMKQKRRDWVPKEMAYIEDFIRAAKGHFKRLAKIAFWDGVDFHVGLEGAELPARESYKQSSVSELSENEIKRMMDILFFKFEHHPDFPTPRDEFDRLKGIVIANYDITSQIGKKELPGGEIREYYIKPPMSSIKTG
jgi:signal recognition particle subunit SEC65